MSTSIQFLGAAETVTGSCYLVQHEGVKFLVDCGMFQGPDVEERNLFDFDFDASTIDFALLTHTHIDHSGMMPKLTKFGFRGPIYATPHTIQLATILMLDSAKIQENNYREGIPWKHAGKVQLVYNTADAEQAISQLSAVNMDDLFTPAKGINVTFVKAAHVLGAASIEIEMGGEVFVFSGDIGRQNHDLIGGFDLDHKREVDYIVMESLYGGEYHPKRQESVAEMMTAIKETLESDGSVFIPCFAVQRTQEILNDLKIAKQSGVIGGDVPVYLDSPMAQRVTNIYSQALDHSEDSLFDFPGLKYIRNYRQSQKISRKSGQIIIAGSGMASGGRIVEHLMANLGNSKNLVCFVGYQAEATLGRELTELEGSGVKSVVINDKDIKVNARIMHMHGFSAHGDTGDYLSWVERYNSPRLKQIFLVHAEPERAEALQEVLNSKQIDHPVIARWKERIELN
ncbi:MBL fold metallo-hydrolase [Candidatus Dojkabacteria bacterium]|uniref:MBL fold metallo-hydrolase n=1 Tax=Candidatus Dojkabacteria bacterium TaxID=2099670 RepID=A0A955I6N0_9BACT|nr:MBL fold metallo-hydrolase [Candidatus Dojkabacteria bacterium]